MSWFEKDLNKIELFRQMELEDLQNPYLDLINDEEEFVKVIIKPLTEKELDNDSSDQPTDLPSE